MIQAVTTPAHKQAFATAIQGAPYFRAVMGRDLALWADNPGAPVRLFTLPGAALTLNGSTAQLCGTPQDWEELLSFLQFAGIAHLIAEETPLLPAAAGSRGVSSAIRWAMPANCKKLSSSSQSWGVPHSWAVLPFRVRAAPGRVKSRTGAPGLSAHRAKSRPITARK